MNNILLFVFFIIIIFLFIINCNRQSLGGDPPKYPIYQEMDTLTHKGCQLHAVIGSLIPIEDLHNIILKILSKSDNPLAQTWLYYFRQSYEGIEQGKSCSTELQGRTIEKYLHKEYVSDAGAETGGISNVLRALIMLLEENASKEGIRMDVATTDTNMTLVWVDSGAPHRILIEFENKDISKFIRRPEYNGLSIISVTIGLVIKHPKYGEMSHALLIVRYSNGLYISDDTKGSELVKILPSSDVLDRLPGRDIFPRLILPKLVEYMASNNYTIVTGDGEYGKKIWIDYIIRTNLKDTK